MELAVWRFYLDCGRMGDLEGIFTATVEEVEASYGKYVYLGEVLGKHSEVYFDMEPGMLSRVVATEDQVAWFATVVGSNGINPLEYVREEDDE
jgi:hypothetical protein